MMVIIVERFHLFPFRTQKLSFHASTIFGWRRPEKIDRCHQPDENSVNLGYFFVFRRGTAKPKRVPRHNLFVEEISDNFEQKQNMKFDCIIKIIFYVFLKRVLTNCHGGGV